MIQKVENNEWIFPPVGDISDILGMPMETHNETGYIPDEHDYTEPYTLSKQEKIFKMIDEQKQQNQESSKLTKIDHLRILKERKKELASK